MYYYIFEQPKDRKETRLFDKIRMALEDQRIVGEIVKANPIQKPLDLARTGLAKGYSTIVVVGSDDLINKTSYLVAESKAALGCIPTNPKSPIYSLLGTAGWEEACKILPIRKIAKIDLCRIGDEDYFLGSVKVVSTVPHPQQKDAAAKIPIILDFGHYKARSKVADIDLRNGDFINGDPEQTRRTFQDGKFSVVFTDELEAPVGLWSKLLGRAHSKEPTPKSVFFTHKMRIAEGKFLILSGNDVICKTPATIQTIPAYLKIVVGRLVKTNK